MQHDTSGRRGLVVRRVLGSMLMVALGGVSAAAAPADSERLARAKDLIASEQWDGAVAQLTAAAADRREPARDEALFWLAHSLHETGGFDEALAAIGRLEREFPRSRWVKPARSLQIEIAQQQGRTDLLLAPMGLPHIRVVPRGAPARLPGPPPEPPAPPAPPPADLDLQLQALQVLIDTGARHGLDTTPTVTVLSDLVQSAGDPALRRRALFVLAQTRDPNARAVIRSLAESGAPDVRVFAVQQLGLFGGADARQPLIEIYRSGAGDVKRQVLRSFRIRGDRGALADVARRERDGALRDQAIQQLGLLGGRRELMDLYRSGLPAAGKIVEALFAGGAREELLRISREAADAKIRAEAAARAAALATGAREDLDRLAREIERAAADRRKAGADHADQASPDRARRKP